MSKTVNPCALCGAAPKINEHDWVVSDCCTAASVSLGNWKYLNAQRLGEKCIELRVYTVAQVDRLAEADKWLSSQSSIRTREPSEPDVQF